MLRYIIIALSFLSLGVMDLPAISTAWAQLSSEGGPIRIRSDSSEVFEKDGRVVFVGSVDIVQGDARLTANKLTINYLGDDEEGSDAPSRGFGEIRDLVAEGDVFYITPEIKARGDDGIYTEATRTIVLTGTVLLKRGEDVARGCKMTMRIDDERSQLSGCEKSGVLMVINPSSAEDEG